VSLPRPAAVAAVLLGLVPLLAVAAVDAATLGLSPGQAAWTAVLLVAGGHVTASAWLGASLLAGCAVAAVMIVLRPPPAPAAGPGDVTVRGPLTYAGPGSLGGTESALRS
jgi:apolipoprotein N-acyltransferase